MTQSRQLESLAGTLGLRVIAAFIRLFHSQCNAKQRPLNEVNHQTRSSIVVSRPGYPKIPEKGGPSKKPQSCKESVQESLEVCNSLEGCRTMSQALPPRRALGCHGLSAAMHSKVIGK